jgi:hypothetical protein
MKTYLNVITAKHRLYSQFPKRRVYHTPQALANVQRDIVIKNQLLSHTLSELRIQTRLGTHLGRVHWLVGSRSCYGFAYFHSVIVVNEMQ